MKKQYFCRFVSFLILVIVLQGCTEKNEYITNVHNYPDAPETRLYGRWQITGMYGESSRYSMSHLRYLNINRDNSLNFLYGTNIGFRTTDSDLGLITSSQISFQNGIFNYAADSNDLMIWRPEITMVATRNDSGPGDTDWIIPLAPNPGFEPSHSNIRGLVWHAGSIWLASFKYILRLDTLNGHIVDSIPLSFNISTLEWIDNSLWVFRESDRRLCQIDPYTGALLANGPTLNRYLTSMIWVGSYFWCSFSNYLIKYNPANNTFSDSTGVDGYVEGIDYYDGRLYMSCYGVINVCQISPLKVEAAYRLEGSETARIDIGGGFLWAAGWQKIRKVKIEEL